MGEVETDEVMLIADSTYDIDLKPHSDQQLDTELQLTFQDATDDEEEEILPMEVAEPEPEEEALNFGTSDPALLLKTLSPMLGNNGEIRGIAEVPTILKLMKDAEKLVTKCVYSNILRATVEKPVLAAFIAEGGWDVLNDWLQLARADINDAFLRELLKVYSQIPITVNLLKQNSCAKTIKQISKSDNAALKILAADIVDKWMSTVRQSSGDSSSDKSKKKKHHHHHKDKDSKDKESSSSSRKSSKSSEDKPRSSPERDATPLVNGSNGSSKAEPSKPRAKTVKAVPTKFRSTGLEQETVLPPARKKGSTEKDIKSVPLKRPSLTLPKSTPPEKKPRPALPSPLPSSTTPPDKKGGIKLIAARPKPVQVYESAGFMDALTTTVLTAPGIRRKRKGSGSGKPNTPTSPPGSKQPSVPSFYQDTLENEEDTERSKSPENAEGDEKEGTPTGDDKESTGEGSSTPSQTETETPVPKKKKKKVSWVEDSQLKQFFYFELDETERVNVNRQKDFASSIKQDMMMERQCMESAKRQHGGSDDGALWRRPRPISGLHQPVIRGCNSEQKDIQKQREQGVLQALFFSKSMIPDSPGEMEPETVEPEEPRIIPTEDETGSAGETVYTEYPKPVENVEPPPISLHGHHNHNQHQHQHQSSHHAPPKAPSGGLSLHPDVASLVANLAHQATSDQRAAAEYQTLQQHQLAEAAYAQAMQTATRKPAYNSPQSYSQGSNLPPPSNMMGMPPSSYANYGPPPPHGPPPHGPPPHGPPPPHMSGMRPDEEWGENMRGGPMMNHRGPPPPPRGYRNMGPRGPPGPPRGRGPPVPQGPPRVCRHFLKAGGCKFEKNCVFLHPGINGPPL